MTKAKTASKNNPSTREKAKEVFYNGKKVKPVKFIGTRKYMAIQFEDGSLPTDPQGNPIPWNMIQSGETA